MQSTWMNGRRNWWRRGFVGRLALPVFCSAAHAGSDWCFVLAYLAGAWFTVQEVWERLQKRELDVHFLMLAVAVGSASIGAWGEGAMLLFLFSFSGALEHYALGRTQREIHSLFRDAPKSALVLDDVRAMKRKSQWSNCVPGMRLLDQARRTISRSTAEVSKGQTASDESNLTG